MRSICGNCLDKRKGENYEVNFIKARFISSATSKITRIFYGRLKTCRLLLEIV